MGPRIFASELMALVQGVSRRYWPRHLKYAHDAYPPYFHCDLHRVCDEYAVLLFEAAFTNALIGEGFHTFKWEGGADDTHDNVLRLYDREYPFRTHAVQALAMALEDNEEAERIAKIEAAKEQGDTKEGE